MPGGDRSGPMGMGPRSGRAAGYCAGFQMPGSANSVAGMGGGGRRGFRGCGRGWRNWFGFGGYAPPYREPTPALEKQALIEQSETLQSQLDSIKKRLSELETGASQ